MIKPMIFAQTKSDDPKKGASSLEAASSMVITENPEIKAKNNKNIVSFFFFLYRLSLNFFSSFFIMLYLLSRLYIRE
jgi:hypothetical protein